MQEARLGWGKTQPVGPSPEKAVGTLSYLKVWKIDGRFESRALAKVGFEV